MSLALIIGIIAAWAIFPALVLFALVGRRLKARNDATDEHADGHGIGGGEILYHESADK